MNNGCQQGVRARFNYTKHVWLRNGCADRWEHWLKSQKETAPPLPTSYSYPCTSDTGVYVHGSAAGLVASIMEKQQ